MPRGMALSISVLLFGLGLVVAAVLAPNPSGGQQYYVVDSTGHLVVVGQGSAGTPAGGVVSIQGVSSGTNVPISITNTAGTTDPCQNPSVLKSSAKFTLTTTTAVSVVALVAGKITYVCGWEADIQGSATTVGTVQLEYGTTTTNPCDTGTVTLTPALQGNITANVPTVVGRSGPGTIFSTAASNVLCAVATGTTIVVNGDLTYVQQ